MSAASRRFSGFSPRSRKGKAAGAVIACTVLLLAGCGGSDAADADGPVIRGDVLALSVSNTPPSGTTETPITLTTAGGSSTGAVTFAVMGNGCTITDASLTASTTGTCYVTATQGTETSAVVAFTIGAKVMTVTFSSRKTSPTGGGQIANSRVYVGDGYDVTASNHDSGISLAATPSACFFTNDGGWTASLLRNSAGTCYVTAYLRGEQVSDTKPFIFYEPCQTEGQTVGMTFDANGGSGLMENQSEQVTVVPVLFNINPNVFQRSGYRFGGWATTLTGSAKYVDQMWIEPCGVVSLWATWVAVLPSTVTFNANGGTGSIPNQSASTATPLTLNTNALNTTAFTRSGYAFGGWATIPTGTVAAYADGASYPFKASATLYATWVAVPSSTVTFDANDGTGTMPAQGAVTTTALNQNAFTRTGYAFNGWNTSKNGSGTAYADGASYPFTANATLYATWGCLPLTVPVTVSAKRVGANKAEVYFTAPSSESPWKSFAANAAKEGGKGATRTTALNTGTITVTGLDKNSGYTFDVTATNAAGCSYKATANRITKW